MNAAQSAAKKFTLATFKKILAPIAERYGLPVTYQNKGAWIARAVEWNAPFSSEEMESRRAMVAEMQAAASDYAVEIGDGLHSTIVDWSGVTLSPSRVANLD